MAVVFGVGRTYYMVPPTAIFGWPVQDLFLSPATYGLFSRWDVILVLPVNTNGYLSVYPMIHH